MKLLFTHRFFWPDTPPYALMLREIAGHFATPEAGPHEVHAFASQPSYRDGGAGAPARETLDGIKVRRCFAFQGEKRNPVKRLANVVIYCLALMLHILRLRPDVVTASTFPPVAAGWCASLASRMVGARFIYHMQDIHPEVSVYSGGALGKGVLRRVLTWLDNQTLRRSAAIVTLSEDMADTLRARGLGPLPIHVINNFELTDFDASPDAAASVDPALLKAPGTTRVIFAGNLGRFQNLPALSAGIARCFDDHPDLELMFLGSGQAEAELKAAWGAHPQVRFAPFMPFAQAQSVIADADIGLVSLTPDIYRVAYPSKILTYAGLGLPVFALVEPESRLAQDLEAKGQGVVPQSPAPDDIAAALERFLSQRSAGAPTRIRADWTRTDAMAAWQTLLKSGL
ncbi:glycosyltransferase family 4 protein [Shimia ponticola]|uniref:glycosyltransferase family 4 protein n=1 Tax=Shimia ponticola TaxID=2582893 RepID=UPI0011BEB36E|nr:glycosyltransferase family 4 protein [Shimia ponticola]